MRKTSFITEKIDNSEKIDLVFLMLVIIFCGLGITTLYSGSSGYAKRIFNNPLYFVKRQFIHMVIGFTILIVVASINLEKTLKYLPFILIGSIVLLLLPFIPGIGLTRNGASRWIRLGITTIQPSELAKLVLVLFLANIFSKETNSPGEFKANVYRASIVTGLMSVIIYLQSDFSTAIFILVLAFVMFFISGVKISFFINIILMIIPFIAVMILSKEYRIQRVVSFLNPNRDPLGAGYQVNASLLALKESGLWGLGLGNGVRKISSIPEVQSDFIFAAWAEEMGFIGVLVYFILLLTFAFRAYKISFSSASKFYTLLGVGCTSIIFLQSIMNSGVVVRFFPATGIALPFFSSGGSSLIITLITCGCILNVSKNKNVKEYKYG